MDDDLATRKAMAVRSHINRKARAYFGNYEKISEATGVPQKTVYRYLGNGKDWTMPPLPFIVELVDLLHDLDDGDEFDAFYARAIRDIQ